MTVDAPVVDEVDLTDPEVFRDGPPYEFFARLRREAPVAWQPTSSAHGVGLWLVTRHADVVAVERDPETFSSSHQLGGTLIEPVGADAGLHLINKDSPEHFALRAHVRRPFVGRQLDAIRDRVATIARQVVAAAAGKGHFDMATDVAAKIPAMALVELLEIPAADRPRFLDWIDGLLRNAPQDRSKVPSQHATELLAYVLDAVSGGSDQVARRSAVLSELTSHQVDGRPADPLELCMFLIFLTFAGNTTMRSAITGGTLALLQHPEEQARLLADRSLLRSAADEVLRYVSPVNYFRRTATRDTDLAGVTIPAGATVTLWYCSANRDELRFAEPDRFDVGRSPNPHLAFGGFGPHYCLGASFARIQLAAVVGEIVSQLLPRLELAGAPVRAAFNHENEISHLPVRVR